MAELLLSRDRTMTSKLTDDPLQSRVPLLRAREPR